MEASRILADFLKAWFKLYQPLCTRFLTQKEVENKCGTNIDDVVLLHLNNTAIQKVQKNGFLNFMLFLLGEELRMEFGISLTYPTALPVHPEPFSP